MWPPNGWHCWECGPDQPAVGDRVEVLSHRYMGLRGVVSRVIEGGGETTTDYVVFLDTRINVPVYGCGDIRKLGVLDLLAEI